MNWNDFFKEENMNVGSLIKANPAYMNLMGAYEEIVTANKALDSKTTELIALACTVLTGCEFCMRAHAEKAVEAGATREEVVAAIATAHSVHVGIALVKGSHVLGAFDSIGK